MKTILLLSIIVASHAASASCDLALIRGQSAGRTYDFDSESVELLEKKGYRAYHVDNAFEAGLTNANYIGWFEANCSKNIFNPLMTSTVTTLTVSREKGIKYETMTKVSSAPQVAFGTCKVELKSLIAKVPRCK